MQLLASHTYLELYLHEGRTQALEARWKGPIRSAVLRHAALEAVELARKHRLGGWVADDRLLGPLRAQDLEWIATYMLPLLVKWGLQRFACVQAINPVTQQLVGPVQENAARRLSFEVRSFTDIQEARTWACG